MAAFNKRDFRMRIPAIMITCLVLGMAGMAQIGFVHPFIPVTTGNEWVYRYTIASFSYTPYPTTDLDSGSIFIKVISNNSIRIIASGVCSKHVFNPSDTLSNGPTIETYNDTSLVSSLDDINSLARHINSNPFVVDSMFFNDTARDRKATYFNGAEFVENICIFEQVVFKGDTLFRQTLSRMDNFVTACNFSQEGRFLEKYGLIEYSYGYGCDMSNSNWSLTLVSFNGQPVDTTQIKFLRDVGQIEMEKLYPAYAVNRSPVMYRPNRNSSLGHSIPSFTLLRTSAGAELDFVAPLPYSISILTLTGRNLQTYRGGTGAQRLRLGIRFCAAGLYAVTYTSGRDVAKVKIMVP
jgi:hypothetical protein